MVEEYTIPLSKIIENQGLRPIYLPRSPENIMICSRDVNRPGMELNGFVDYFDPKRVAILGMSEMGMLNRLRDEQLRNIPFDELEPLLADNPNHRIETEDLMRLVAEAVADLPLRCREIYLKSREEELSNAEIARELSISVKTVEAQITKALRRIRHRIGEA